MIKVVLVIILLILIFTIPLLHKFDSSVMYRNDTTGKSRLGEQTILKSLPPVTPVIKIE